MKDKNELILDKLVEIGAVSTTLRQSDKGTYEVYKNADGQGWVTSSFNPLESCADFMLVLNALISECGKRGYRIALFGGALEITGGYVGHFYYYGIYTRQSVAEAFIKVTGIEV